MAIRGDGNLYLGKLELMYIEVQLVLIKLAWENFPKDLDKKGVQHDQRYLKFLYL